MQAQARFRPTPATSLASTLFTHISLGLRANLSPHWDHESNPRWLAIQLSLLLAASCTLLLPLASHDLAKHHHAVAVQESDTREAFAVLEAVAHQRLLWLEGALSHLVRLQRVGVLHLLTAGLFAHLPLETRDAARRPAAAHEADGRVTDLDLRVELLGLPEGRVLLVDHHVTPC